MKIPKSFKLFGTTINVVFDSKKLDKDGSIGLAENLKSLITLTDISKGSQINKDVVIDSFYHEKVHMILDAMREYKLSGDEKFVEVFSRLLRQSDESAEY